MSVTCKQETVTKMSLQNTSQRTQPDPNGLSPANGVGGQVNFLATLPALYLIDRSGRRRSLAFARCVCCTSSGSLACRRSRPSAGRLRHVARCLPEDVLRSSPPANRTGTNGRRAELGWERESERARERAGESYHITSPAWHKTLHDTVPPSNALCDVAS